jgi:hypothetical protein
VNSGLLLNNAFVVSVVLCVNSGLLLKKTFLSF